MVIPKKLKDYPLNKNSAQYYILGEKEITNLSSTITRLPQLQMDYDRSNTSMIIGVQFTNFRKTRIKSKAAELLALLREKRIK